MRVDPREALRRRPEVRPADVDTVVALAEQLQHDADDRLSVEVQPSGVEPLHLERAIAIVAGRRAALAENSRTTLALGTALGTAIGAVLLVSTLLVLVASARLGEAEAAAAEAEAALGRAIDRLARYGAAVPPADPAGRATAAARAARALALEGDPADRSALAALEDEIATAHLRWVAAEAARDAVRTSPGGSIAEWLR